MSSTRNGSRRGAGQALLGLAASLPSPQKESLAGVALWLEPRPWLPHSSPWTKGALEALKVASEGDPEGAVLVFGATPKGLDAPHMTIDISLPALTTLERGDASDAWDMPSLMARVAHLVGADGAVYAPGEGAPVIVPAGHHFVTLTKVTPTLDVSRAANARLIARAEDAVLEGRLSEGASLLGLALEGIDDSHSTCLTSAPIHVTLLALAPLTLDTGDHADAILEGCIEREGNEPAVAAYYEALLDLSLDDAEERTGGTREAREEALARSVSSTTGAQRALVMTLSGYIETYQSTPHEVCDDAQSRARDDAFRSEVEKMIAVGRPDLVVSQRAALELVRDGEIDPEALSLWLEEADDPANRWLRDAMIEAVLAHAPSNITLMQQIGLDSSCRLYERTLREAIQADIYDGAARRHGERVMSFLGNTSACPMSRGPGRLISDAVDASLAIRNRGRMPLVALIASLTIHGAMSAFQGRPQDILTVLSALEPKLRDVSKGLGDTPDDRIVKALVDVVTPASRMDPIAARGAISQAIATLGDVITATPVTELERHAPTIRLLLQFTESVLVALTDPASLTAQFQSTHKTMEADLEVALTDMGWDEDAARPLTHHIRAAQSMVTFMLSPSASELPSIREVLTRLEAHTGRGWWGVAFGSLQAMGWALHAHQAELLGDASTRDSSIVLSRERLGVMVDQALTDFDVEKTDWELLRLLIPAHELMTMTLMDADASETFLEQVMKTVAPNMEAVARRILTETSGAASDASNPNIIDLLPGLLELGASIGFANMWDPTAQDIPRAAREKIAQHLESIPGDLTPELQVYLASVAGVLRVTHDRTRAMASFARASRVAKASGDAPFTYLPLLLSLWAQQTEFSDPKKTLALIDESLAQLEPSAQCGRRDGLDAMLPARAHLQAALGDMAGADASLARYLESVGQGFSGNARLECSIEASRGNVSFNVELSVPLGSFLSDTPDVDDDSESNNTLQVGLGFPQVPSDHERFSCTLESEGPQLARVMRARMTRALHQLRAGDDRGAQLSLDGVLEMAIRFANPQAMGPAGALWAAERDQVDVALLSWVVTLARARGLSFTALRIDQARARLVGAQAGAPLPDGLEEFTDLQALSPVLQAIYPAGAWAPDFDALERALALEPVQIALPAWSRDLLWASANSSAGNFDEARETLAKMSAPPNPAVRDALALQLGGPDVTTHDAISKTFDDLIRQGMYGESIALLLSFQGTPVLQGEPMVQLYAKALDEIPHEDVPALRFELLSSVLGSMPDKMDQRLVEAAIADWVDSSPGRAGLEEQARRRLYLVMVSIDHEEYAQAQERVEALTSLLSTQVPLSTPFLVDVLVIEASLAIVLGQSPPLEALAKLGGSVQGITPASKKGLDAMLNARSDEEELKRAALRFLASLI